MRTAKLRLALCALAAIAILSALAGCTGKTTGASSIGPTTATLNATGTCSTSCTARFRYREVSPNLGNWAYTETIPANSTGGKEVAFSGFPTNLRQGATYQYQVCGKENRDANEVCVGDNGQPNTYPTFKTRVRLMTYNVEYFAQFQAASGHGNDPAPEAGIDAIANDIRNAHASVVALEETRVSQGTGSEAQRVANALGWTGPNHVVYAGWPDNPNGVWDKNGCPKGGSCLSKGVALISSFTLDNAHSKALSPIYPNTLDRKLIWADVNLGGGQSLRVYATHLASADSSYGVGYPREQLHNAFDALRAQNGTDGIPRAVFMGDLNLTRSTMGSEYSRITGVGYADWKDSKVGPGDPACGANTAQNPVYACTYPSDSPTQKFDWIWTKGMFETAGAVINNCANGCHSDHRPYWTDVAF
jgi:endonuclease/exonuclease/phosphatase family metal-dependent hydrolase